MMKIALIIGAMFAVDARIIAEPTPVGQAKPHSSMVSCRSKRFNSCPDVFTMEFAANYCALNRNGELTQFTYECQACTRPEFLGVMKGPCPIRQNIAKLPTVQKPIRCPLIRPTEQACPQRYYFVAPSFDICGVDKFGAQKGFDIACSACKDQTIYSYYNRPCEKKIDAV